MISSLLSIWIILFPVFTLCCWFSRNATAAGSVSFILPRCWGFCVVLFRGLLLNRGLLFFLGYLGFLSSVTVVFSSSFSKCRCIIFLVRYLRFSIFFKMPTVSNVCSTVCFYLIKATLNLPFHFSENPFLLPQIKRLHFNLVSAA